MAASFEEALAEEMAQRESQGLLRRATPQGPGPVDFQSNDYLGLARDARVIEGARRALVEHGAGGRASRLLGGGAALYEEVEATAADWLGAEAALLFASGYQANLGLLTALAGPGVMLFSDELNHASLIDGARLSRATIEVHRHLDFEQLGGQLARAHAARRRFVVAESIYSMGGDLTPVAELLDLCERHDAYLILDEAHAIGVLGPEGAGAWMAAGRPHAARLIARVVTGGKSLGTGGALVVGSRVLREHLVNRARSFIYSTAPPPAVAGALAASLPACREADEARRSVLRNARELASGLGLAPPDAAIVPFLVGDPVRALERNAWLAARGLAVGAVRPPTVPPGASQLRLVCHSFNTRGEVDELVRALSEEPRESATSTGVGVVERAPTLFVVGTDTDIGKTVVSALLLAAARRRGEAAYWKPVQTGLDSDTEAVARMAAAEPRELLRPAWSLPLPASPHEAAEDAGKTIEIEELARGLEGLRRTLAGTQLVVELAGGMMVPYLVAPGRTRVQADWLAEARLPLVLVARSGLGTLNHTLLTLEALRHRHLEPRALFLVGESHPSNRRTLVEMGQVPLVFEVPRFEVDDAGEPTPRALADYLDRTDLGEVFR